MNKYSDLSNRYLLTRKSLENNSTPRPKNLIESLSMKDITYHRYYSKSPDISICQEPVNSHNSLFGISQLSYDHNQKFKDIPELSPARPLSIKLPEISPKHSDFSSLLDKIEKVISPKPRHLHTLLHEDEPQKIIQTSNEYKFFKISCKGKRCPLQIQIKLHEGKLTSYISYSESQPTYSNHERAFNYTYFELNDKTHIFKYDHVFIGVRSFSYCVYKIHINFGKVITMASIKKVRQNTIRDELEADSIEVEDKEKKRNFIKENIETAISPSKSPELKTKLTLWETKKKQAREKRNGLIKIKRERALEKLNRKERLFEENLKHMQQVEKENNHRKMISFWISLHVFHNVASYIRKKIGEIKEKKLNKFRSLGSIRHIQRFYRNSIKFPDNMYPLLVLNHSLLLYNRTCRCIHRESSADKIISAFLSSSQKNKLAHNFQIYCKKIVFIQKQFREYIERKQKRFHNLIALWNRIIEKFLFNKKKKSTRRKESIKYSTIPNNRRNDILAEVYYIKWKAHREKIRNLIKDFKPYKIIRQFLKERIDPPTFDYYPSDIEMIELIQKSLRSNSKEFKIS